jgi:two-component system phosphate regulon response regulator PhoB/two-component system alkaline phosphatase synthesis response regulator PhoP
MENKELIFIVEDEEDIRELISLHLQDAGYQTEGFETGKEMFARLDIDNPDLLVLDLMLPDMDGMDICRHIRQSSKFEHIPILMLTARTDVTDKVMGLEYGADDYLTKPFSHKELIARIKAILRRASHAPKQAASTDLLRIDKNRYEVFVRGEMIDLTTTEFKILELLLTRPGWVFSREKILDYLWGSDKIVIDRTIDVHIRHLRQKLSDLGSNIKNVRGIGYKYDPTKAIDPQ